MSVERILRTKGRDVFTIAPEHSVGAAIATLASRRIGAVVVAGPDREVLGIFTERDVVRLLGEHGPAALQEPVSRFMTTRVETCTPATSATQVMETMTAGKFRHLPVVEGGKLTGLVSIGDVVKLRLADIEAESEALRAYIASG